MSINGAQSLRLEKRAIEIKNLFKQILVPFKIYSDFECVLKNVTSYEGSCTKRYQDHVPCSFAYKFVCVDDKFSISIVLYKGENTAYKLIEAILEEYENCNKVMKKHFKKNLIMTEEEKEQFQLSSYCWRCKNEAH